MYLAVATSKVAQLPVGILAPKDICTIHSARHTSIGMAMVADALIHSRAQFVYVSMQIPAPAKVVQVLGALLSSEAESAASLPFGGGGMWGTDDGYSSGSEEELEGSALEHVENEAVLKAAG